MYLESKVHHTTEKFQMEILRSLCNCEFTEEIIAHGIPDRSTKVSSSVKGLVAKADPVEMSAQCRRSKMTVAKVLQLKNFEIFNQLTKECEIDVVHLIRDPRASIKSRMDTFQRIFADEPELEKFTPELIAGASEKICTEMLTRAEQLVKYQHVLQHTTILYENVAKSPVSAARTLFHTLGITWSEHVEKHVIETVSGSNEGGGFDTVKDTSRVVGRWRKGVDEEYVQAVEKSCAELMSRFGYSRMFPEF